MIPTYPNSHVPTTWSGDHVEIPAQPPAPAHKLLVTPEEAAAILSVGRTTVYELMATGQLQSVRIKSSRRIPIGSLERFVRRLLDDQME